MNPIPEGASPSDARWEVAFLDLAHGLVLAGAKAKVISRFTDFPLSRIRKMYKSLRGTAPPAGPVVQGSARFFALPGKHTSTAWSIQSAVFLACYDRVGHITETPPHRGWHLLAAFTVYLSLTEKLYKTASIKRLDINQAYALLSHCGFLAQASVELQRRDCATCLITYAVVATEPISRQRCPICAMNANNIRLASQAVAASAR